MIQIESRNIVDVFRQWLLAGVDLIFPSRCAGCDQLAKVWCERCHASLQFITKPFCHTCGKPGSKPSNRCTFCTDYPSNFKVRAFAKYQGPLLRAILQLKYRPNCELAQTMSLWLSDVLSHTKWRVDLIVPIPLGRKRFRSRGYNQASLIAEGLGELQGLEICEHALTRIRETESQVGLDPVARRMNVQDAFRSKEEIIYGKKILLVDDLVTTGATLSACAKSLFDAGAEKVYGIAVARA